jgi:hypothetical protein
MECSTYLWYLPDDVRALAKRLREGGCTHAVVKAGGDGGRVWAQWGAACDPLAAAGLEVVPFFYIHPHDGREDEAIIQALRNRPAEIIMLNPESEWRGLSNRYATEWVHSLRERLVHEFGRAPKIGFSSVPTWADFPYEGFSRACDLEHPQVYWRPHRADQVAASNRRAREGAVVVPILPACQAEDAGNDGMEWTDAALAELAQYCLTGLRDLAGFSGWQSGATGPGGRARRDYAHKAMAAAYALLPELQLTAATVGAVGAPLPLPFNDSPNPAVWHCSRTNVWVVEPAFLAKYQQFGDKALELFGLPVVGMVVNQQSGLREQYFERARFKLQKDGTVSLGLVGAELYAQLAGPPAAHHARAEQRPIAA